MIKQMVKQRVPFVLRQTNQRMELKSELGNYSNIESEFPASELNFIQSVKKYILANGLEHTIVNKFKRKEDKKKIKYYMYSRKLKPGMTFSNCYEIDLNSAYWNTAHQLGLLSDALYQKGKTVSKISRLAAIGSLAKKVKVYEFDGKEQKLKKIIRSEETEFLWDTICYTVGEVMKEVSKACGDDFVFFWTDALFIKPNSVNLAKQVFKAAGYDFKMEKVDLIQVTDQHLIVTGKGKTQIVNGEKVFVNKRPFPFQPK